MFAKFAKLRCHPTSVLYSSRGATSIFTVVRPKYEFTSGWCTVSGGLRHLYALKLTVLFMQTANDSYQLSRSTLISILCMLANFSGLSQDLVLRKYTVTIAVVAARVVSIVSLQLIYGTHLFVLAEWNSCVLRIGETY